MSDLDNGRVITCGDGTDASMSIVIGNAAKQEAAGNPNWRCANHHQDLARAADWPVLNCTHFPLRTLHLGDIGHVFWHQ